MSDRLTRALAVAKRDDPESLRALCSELLRAGHGPSGEPMVPRAEAWRVLYDEAMGQAVDYCAQGDHDTARTWVEFARDVAQSAAHDASGWYGAMGWAQQCIDELRRIDDDLSAYGEPLWWHLEEGSGRWPRDYPRELQPAPEVCAYCEAPTPGYTRRICRECERDEALYGGDF